MRTRFFARLVRVGVPAEIKPDEHRVALTPAGARELTDRGHDVCVQAGAGVGSDLSDDAFRAQGCTIAATADDVFAGAELILKVKEPQPEEVARLQPHHVLFTYLHLAPDAALTQGLLDSRATCVAYETVEDRDGRLPLLAPMSEVAGKLAAQAGAFILSRPSGGRGVLLGGVPGVRPGRVLVIGGGVVGRNAATVAAGMGADVIVADRDLGRLRELDATFGTAFRTVHASTLTIEELLVEVDLVIGAVLVAGARAPSLVRREHLRRMREAAVIVDVAIDQGGCVETARPTTHSDPTYAVDGVTHYCVANMPGAVPVTATAALTNATLPYILRLADVGVREALMTDDGFMKGLNVIDGRLTYAPVADAQGRAVQPAGEALAAYEEVAA